MQKRPVVFIIYYSMYGHVERMATEVCAGVEAAGCECRIFQIPETLPNEVLAKMRAKEKNQQVPTIKVEQLSEADGILFGVPTRFGSVPAQVRTLFDQCGGHWKSDTLIGKPVSILSLSHYNLTLVSYIFINRLASFSQRAHSVVAKRPQHSPV
jgi:NAD(P)H dehydrogenase (quinone)